MAAKFQITVDCSNPDRLARFWAPALGYVLQPAPEGHATWRDYWLSVGVPENEIEDGYDSIIDPSGDGIRIWFQKVPERKSIKNRLHFDVLVGGGRSLPISERRRRVDEAVERLLAAGATMIKAVEAPQVDHYFVAMRDPEGNEFDVV
ncbi:MAG TPA: VOC family protein [Acidimicrobiia bacterium]|nr:VOC family protein [Acidimicrobiia bacterium]